MDNENKYSIQDLDEYIRQGEPERREKAIAWQTAIGLQAVDGLTVSDYLIELAIKNILRRQFALNVFDGKFYQII